jgi:signal transduction histidine kinase
VLQVARPLAPYESALTTLKTILIIGSLLAAGLTAGVSWWLARAALRPLDQITQTAEIIGAARDFSRRLRPSRVNDEVGRLATTFNAMLTELEQAFQQQAAALAAQRRFVADASHELRTPLTTIRGNLGLLQRDPPIRERDRIAVLHDTVDETERLIRLVNNLLLLARNDAGQQLDVQPVAVGPLLAELVRQTRVLAPELEVTAEVDRPLSVLANPDALKQVLLILLDNARQHTPPGGRITLRAVPDGEQVAIAVADTGEGIPPEELPQIFERFYRADKARSGGGAGLGLAIARELVAAQKGAITVESAPGAGSVFTIRLPAAGASQPVALAPAGSVDAQHLSPTHK